MLIAGSIIITYWRIVVKRDYIIENKIDCDPYSEACFVWKCNPDSEDETKCSGDLEKDIWHYKIIKKKAANVPLCNPAKEENCNPWFCAANEKDCLEILCDEETKVEQGVECSNAVKYLKENPIETAEEESEKEEFSVDKME